jgi:hypothetical protein
MHHQSSTVVVRNVECVSPVLALRFSPNGQANDIHVYPVKAKATDMEAPPAGIS